MPQAPLAESWAQTLADGFVGAMVSSAVSVLVAVIAIRYTQRNDAQDRREALSLAAAERLTAALLEAIRRLGQLSDHTVAGSRAGRMAAVRAMADDLQVATDLHSPVLSRRELWTLPEHMQETLQNFVAAIDRREEQLMREERLTELDEDRAYVADRADTLLRRQLTDHLRAVTGALTAYRREEKHVTLPPQPDFAAGPAGGRVDVGRRPH